MGAVVKKENVAKFTNCLKPGLWKIIHGFNLVPSTGLYKPSVEKYKITFNYKTTVNKSDDLSDDLYLSLAKFDAIISGVLDKNVLIGKYHIVIFLHIIFKYSDNIFYYLISSRYPRPNCQCWRDSKSYCK